MINFLVETDRDGEHVHRATAVLHAAKDDEQPPAHDIAGLLRIHRYLFAPTVTPPRKRRPTPLTCDSPNVSARPYSAATMTVSWL